MFPPEIRARNTTDRSALAARGFTLVELLLVLGLLATLAALAVPSFQAMLQARRLEAGGEQLRTFLRQARRAAIESGVNYRVDVQPGSGRLRVCPAADPVSARETGSDQAAGPVADSRTETGVVQPEPVRTSESLPPGVVLVTADSFSHWLKGGGVGNHSVGAAAPVGPSGAEPGEPVAAVTGAGAGAEPTGGAGAADEGSSDDAGSGEDWLPWFEFYPDGTARLASVVLLDGQRRFLEAKVEEMTGEVLLSSPRSAEDLDTSSEEAWELDE